MNSGSHWSMASGGNRADRGAGLVVTTRPDARPFHIRAGTFEAVYHRVYVWGYSFRAFSTLCFSGTRLPPRTPSSAVMTGLAIESLMRSRKRVGRK